MGLKQSDFEIGRYIDSIYLIFLIFEQIHNIDAVLRIMKKVFINITKNVEYFVIFSLINIR